MDLIMDLRTDYSPEREDDYPGEVIEAYKRERRQAADALEAQAEEIAQLEAALGNTMASLAASISLLERGSKKAAPSDKMFDQMLADYRKSLNGARQALI